MAHRSQQSASDCDGQKLFAQLSKTWRWVDILQLRNFLRARSETTLWESYTQVERLCECDQIE